MSAAATPGTPLVKLSSTLCSFYAARGMWIDEKPEGWLSTVLGSRARIDGMAWFYASPEQVRALMRDIAENGRRGLNGQQIAQYLRRFREALQKAGEPVDTPKDPGSQRPSPCTPAREVPFEPLVVPFAGKARQAFIHHAWSCLTELVEYEQTSAYGEGAAP